MRVLMGAMLVASFGCSEAVELSDWCRVQSVASCRRSQRCGLTSQSVDCESLPLKDCVAPYQAALDAGVLRFDGVAARQCASALEARSCEGFGAGLEPCRTIWVGVGFVGATCGTCEAGLTCVSQGQACGVCLAMPRSEPPSLPGAGEECTPPEVDGAGCQSGLRCAGGVCVTPVPNGSACDDQHPCRSWVCRDGQCVGRPDEGQACEGTGNCLLGLWCDQGTCRSRLSIGASCTIAEQCLTSLCFDGVCSGPRAEGETCASTDCDFNLTCADGTCVRLPGPGESCAPQVGCANFARCLSGTCFDPRLECQ